MNRKRKLLFIGGLAILYLIIAINFHKIRFAISMLRIYNQEKISDTTNNDKDTTNKVVDNPLKDILSVLDDGDNSVRNDDDYIPPIENNDDTKDIGNKLKEDNPKSSDGKVTENIPTIKPYIAIISEYNYVLEELRSTFESELDNLIQDGIREFAAGNLSSTQLVNKYLTIGSKLEKSSDTRFSDVVKDMEKELKSNGHETSIIKEIKAYYISFKDSKKTDLINRGMKHVK